MAGRALRRFPVTRATAAWLVAGTLVLVALTPAARAAAEATATDRSRDYQQVIATSQAAIGRPLLDVRLRDTAGKDVRLRDFQGRPLLVSLVYTGCFQACPVTTQFLAQAVREARRALGEDSFTVVSIGFNQPFDTPAAMAAFKRQNRIDEADWHFLSPDPTQVDALTANLGFVYEATPKGFDHVTQVTIVDGEGVIYRQVYGETFDLPMLVQPLKELRQGEASRAVTLDNVWEKVVLYCTVYDPQTGAYRVNYSLFFEIFAGLTTLGAVAWFTLRELRRTKRV